MLRTLLKKKGVLIYRGLGVSRLGAYNGHSSMNMKHGNVLSKPMGTRFYSGSKFVNFASFSFSSILVLGASSAIGITIYTLFKELFGTSSDTKLFHRTLNLIENNLYCRKMLKCDVANEKLSVNSHYNEGRSKYFGGGTDYYPVISDRKKLSKDKEEIGMVYTVASEKATGYVVVKAINEAGNIRITSLSLQVDNDVHYIVKPYTKSKLGMVRMNGDHGLSSIKWGVDKK